MIVVRGQSLSQPPGEAEGKAAGLNVPSTCMGWGMGRQTYLGQPVRLSLSGVTPMRCWVVGGQGIGRVVGDEDGIFEDEEMRPMRERRVKVSPSLYQNECTGDAGPAQAYAGMRGAGAWTCPAAKHTAAYRPGRIECDESESESGKISR